MKKAALVAGTICISTISILAEPTAGKNYRIDFVDVDGNTVSTAGGRVTTVVLGNQSSIDKARDVGDRIPDFCLGNSRYRMITVLTFEEKHSKPVRMILTSLVRRRLDFEGRRLQSRYDRLKIARNARQDVSVVADFDGAISKQLDVESALATFHVFIFGGKGELLKNWKEVPSTEELAAALKQL